MNVILIIEPAGFDKTPLEIHKDWNEITPLSLDDSFYVFSVCKPWDYIARDVGFRDHLKKTTGK